MVDQGQTKSQIRHGRGCKLPSTSAIITLSGALSTGKNDDKGSNLAVTVGMTLLLVAFAFRYVSFLGPPTRPHLWQMPSLRTAILSPRLNPSSQYQMHC